MALSWVQSVRSSPVGSHQPPKITNDRLDLWPREPIVAILGFSDPQDQRVFRENIGEIARNMEGSGAGSVAGRATNIKSVQVALEAAGILFLNGGEPGVRLKKKE
jgi:hypothetical protein